MKKKKNKDRVRARPCVELSTSILSNPTHWANLTHWAYMCQERYAYEK